MTTTHRITTCIALAVALGTSAAPASARPFDLNSSGSNVPAGSVTMKGPSPTGVATNYRQLLNPSPRGGAIGLTQAQSAGQPVRPSPDHQAPQTSNHGAEQRASVADTPICPPRGRCVSPESGQTDGLSYGKQQAAALGFDGGSAGGLTYGEKAAAELGYAGSAVGPISGSSTAGSSTSGRSPRPTAASSPEPFQWADAGIGAAGMLLLVIAGTAAAVTGRRQRRHVTAG